MTNSYYPVALDLRARRCLVAGGGKIATDKVEGLLSAGANVVVVSPQVSDRLEQLAAEEQIDLHRREYQASDLAGVYLVYGATDEGAVNARIAADGRDSGILVNAVDDIPNCDFFAMAICRRGDLQIAISTNGRSPAFARWVREYLDEALPAEFGDLLSLLATARDDLRTRGPIPPYEHWQAAITDEVRLQLLRGEIEEAREQLLAALSGAVEPTDSTAGTRGRQPEAVAS